MTAWVAAIAIDETVACSIASYDQDRLLKVSQPKPASLRSTDQARVISETVHGFFDAIENKLFDLTALSISTIGVIDAANCHVTNIARPGWSTTEINFADIIARWRGMKSDKQPRFFDIYNDASCAALGEYLRSNNELSVSYRNLVAQRNEEISAFIRVGEGINVGLLWNGAPWRGILHPEIGHIRPRRHPKDLEARFKGACRFHGDCVEGLACLEALRQRKYFSIDSASDIRANPEVVEIASFYVAQLCAVVTLTLAPVEIVLGGSIINANIAATVRSTFDKIIGNYPSIDRRRGAYIRTSKQGAHANLWGALELARRRVTLTGPRSLPPR